ncbi:odr-7 [Pristionchus pacificus]|nr:odr-7 [Pristionchus pacificus]
MDPSESLDWYSGLHIVEEGEDAAAAAAAARAAEKQPEESISSVIGSAFSGMVSTEDCMMSGLMQQQHLQQPPADLQQQQQLRPSVLQHTNDHHHHHRESQPPHQSHSRHIIQSSANHQDHAHHHQSVIVQSTTVTSSGSAGYGSSHFPSSSFMPPSTSTASNLFLPHSFMGLSFPEFETSQLPYPVLHSSHQHPSLDLFDPHHWMGVLDGKKEGGNTRRPSFTEAIFPQVFGTAAGQGILDFGSCAAAAAATATASQHQQQQNHAALKHDPLDALYLSPSLPSTLSSPFLIPSSLQAPPTPKGLLVGGGGGVGTVSSGYGTSTVIREAVLDMEKPEDREMMEQECQVCMATTANGLHFGARTCAACAAFFRRSVADAKQYQCKGSQRCTNSANDGTGYRKICRACRLQRCLQIGMQPENVQNKRFRKEDIPMGGTMISDLVGKGQGKGTDIDSLLKINFNQSFGTMGQMQLQQQQPHLHQSTPQSFYC